jgi:hypothetical protein
LQRHAAGEREVEKARHAWSTIFLVMSYQNGGGGADSGPPEDVTAAGPPSAALALNAGQHQPEDESRSRSRPNSHVHYAPTIDPGLAGTARPVLATELAKPALARSDTEAALSPSVRRRLTRAGTFKTVDDFEEFTIRPGWHRASAHTTPVILPHAVGFVC